MQENKKTQYKLRITATKSKNDIDFFGIDVHADACTIEVLNSFAVKSDTTQEEPDYIKTPCERYLISRYVNGGLREYSRLLFSKKLIDTGSDTFYFSSLDAVDRVMTHLKDGLGTLARYSKKYANLDVTILCNIEESADTNGDDE